MTGAMFFAFLVLVFNSALAKNEMCDTSKTIIVMSKGRSGSTFLADVITRNFLGRGYNVTADGEILGSTKEEMLTQKDPLSKINRHICIYGANHQYNIFKWKPVLWSKVYLETLRWVATKKIPVVYNVRNPIDVFISNEKHRLLNKMREDAIKHGAEEKGKEAHCEAGDADCLARFKNLELLNISGTALMRHLVEDSDDSQKSRFDSLEVKFFAVEYENLIKDGKEALRAWREIFEFIAPDKDWDSVTTANITSSFVSTSSENHRAKIINYDEIRNLLRGTRFAPLLH